MRFARAYYRMMSREDDSGFDRVCIAVAEQETPFSMSAIADAEEVELGLVEDFDPKGRSPSHWMFQALKDGLQLPAAVIDCPTSVEGIKQRLRERGPGGIPMKARAWLATILPQDQISAMGVGRGLPISAMKAAEAIRNRRDPHGGSRMFVLERKAQQQADAHAKARHEKRKRAEAKALKAQLHAITGGAPVEEFIARTSAESKALLDDIRKHIDRLGG